MQFWPNLAENDFLKRGSAMKFATIWPNLPQQRLLHKSFICTEQIVSRGFGVVGGREQNEKCVPSQNAVLHRGGRNTT